MQPALFIIFLIGYVVTCLLGTGTGGGAASVEETNMLYQWPGYLLIGAVGLLSAIKWKFRLNHAPCDLCLLLGTLLVGYISLRGFLGSPIYKARMDTALALTALVTFGLMASMFSRPGYRMAWFWTMAAMVFANFIVVLIHIRGDYAFFPMTKVAGLFLGGEGGYARNYLDRAGGFFNDPNHLSSFNLCFIFVAAGLAVFGRVSWLGRIGLAFLAVMAAVSLVATGSRGGFIAVGVGGIIFVGLVLWLSRTVYRFIFWRIVGVLTLGIVTLSGIAFVMARRFIEARFNWEGAQEGMNLAVFDDRKFYWWAALDQFRSSMLVGTGARTYDSYWREFAPLSAPVHLGDARFAHNEFLQMLGDYGIVGLGLLLFLIVLCVAHSAFFLRWFSKHRFPRFNESTNNNVGFTVGAIASVAALAVASLTEFPMHIPAVAIPTACLLALLANPGFENFNYKAIRFPRLRPVVKIGITLAGCLLIYWGVRYFPAERNYELARFADGDDSLGLERIGYLNKAKERDPYNPVPFYHAGQARLAQIRQDLPPTYLASLASKAEEDLVHAVELNPRDVYPRMMLTDCFDLLKKFEEADAMAEGSLALAPYHRNVLLNYAIHHMRLRRFEKAKRYFIYTQNVGRFGQVDTQAPMAFLKSHMEKERLMLGPQTDSDRPPAIIEKAGPRRAVPVEPANTGIPGQSSEALVPANPPPAESAEPSNRPFVPATPPGLTDLVPATPPE